MKALILAAGMGTRLQHHTQTIPKCLVHVGGKSILQYQLEALYANGLRDIIMVIGYQGDKIREYVSSLQLPGLRIAFIENAEYSTTNSAYSFLLASDHLQGETYLHLNCDLLFHADLLHDFLQSGHDNVLLVDNRIPLNDSMEQVIVQQDKIVQMDKANLPGAMGRGSGLAKISSGALDLLRQRALYHLQRGEKNQHCYGLIRWALNLTDFHGFVSPHFFREINTLSELEEAESTLREFQKRNQNGST
ncbi:phosphocholine cytidylyltransferase family protein [Candidatus Woesearchaeota archaeon]|nr:phosphocholine cytidylyltransferase family protein [Candidatus Woesearchaeota archaeon]